jgi:RimJ/RimL family protein N-acetyltransferase
VTGDAVPETETSGTALPVIRTPRLSIRPLADSDADACRSVVATSGEGAFRRWFTWAAAAPAALADLRQPPYGERAVVLAATGELVGLVGLVPSLGPFARLEGAPPGGPWTPELGLYWALSPRHRGHGYATEAAAALCRELFALLNPKRLVAMTEHANVASQAVMRRLGMQMFAYTDGEPSWFQVVGVLGSVPAARPTEPGAEPQLPRTSIGPRRMK